MLSSLRVKNFRSLQDFAVSRLGRINLIVGKNNSGKSSVLEALRLYAGSANRVLLDEIAAEHDERQHWNPSQSRRSSQPWPYEALYSGRIIPDNADAKIFIGQSDDDPKAIQLSYSYIVERQETVPDEDGVLVSRTVFDPIDGPLSELRLDGEVSRALFIQKGKRRIRVRLDLDSGRIRNSVGEHAREMPCSFLSTEFVKQEDLAADWDRIVLTDYEDTLRTALGIVSQDLVDIAFVVTEGNTNRRRSARVKLRNVKFPVPLNSMGDGIVRVLKLVLRVLSAKGGIALIDEFENGLHYSVQTKVWGLLFEIAHALDIQIFATTHSWDCIRSFAAVARENDDVDGVLFRVGKSIDERQGGKTIATVFGEEEFDFLTQSDFEIR